MSIGLDNMTLQQCLCAGGRIARQLTVSLNTTMLVVACQSADGVVECLNFTCPCSRRRTLSASYAICQTVYQAPPQIRFDASQVAMALVSIGRVTDLQTIVLPSNQLVWDNQLITWQPDLATLSIGMLVLYVCVVLVAIGGLALAFSNWCRPSSPQVLFVSEIPTVKPVGSMIRVKIM